MAYPVAMETPPALPHERLGTDPTRSASLYSGAGSACGDLGVHGPRLTGAGPHVTGAAQPDLTEFLTPAVERSAAVTDGPRRPRSQRRRGGQPGHPGHTRTLIPVEEVDEVVVLKPEQCAHCQAPLSGDDPTPFRHQVIEIPPIKPVVTEYQWHQLVCPACGETTRAPWPAGRSQWHLRSPRARHGGAVYGVVSLVQAHDAAGDGRCVRGADECGDDQPVGDRPRPRWSPSP